MFVGHVTVFKDNAVFSMRSFSSSEMDGCTAGDSCTNHSHTKYQTTPKIPVPNKNHHNWSHVRTNKSWLGSVLTEKNQIDAGLKDTRLSPTPNYYAGTSEPPDDSWVETSDWRTTPTEIALPAVCILCIGNERWPLSIACSGVRPYLMCPQNHAGGRARVASALPPFLDNLVHKVFFPRGPLVFCTNAPTPDDETLTKTWHWWIS